MKTARANGFVRVDDRRVWPLILLVLVLQFAVVDACASAAGEVAKTTAQRAVRATAARIEAQRAAAQRAVSDASRRLLQRPRDVIISRSRHPEAAAHIEHAQKNGQPTVLHLERNGASARRSASTGGVRNDRKPDYEALYDRDEYPPAFTREGGFNANVRFINRHDNRGAGAVLHHQTRDLPDGDRIRVIIGP